jgi:hypothetical protein
VVLEKFLEYRSRNFSACFPGSNAYILMGARPQIQRKKTTPSRGSFEAIDNPGGITVGVVYGIEEHGEKCPEITEKGSVFGPLALLPEKQVWYTAVKRNSFVTLASLFIRVQVQFLHIRKAPLDHLFPSIVERFSRRS